MKMLFGTIIGILSVMIISSFIMLSYSVIAAIRHAFMFKQPIVAFNDVKELMQL